MKAFWNSSRSAGNYANLNLLPFISFYYSYEETFLNVGWLWLCIQFKLK